MNSISEQIIFFDGYCNLCNNSVDFIVRRDKKRKFKYASQQSEFAKLFFDKNQFDASAIDSFIVYANNRFYTRSNAFFKVMLKMGFPYYLLMIFLLVPKFIRDWVYDRIAKKRYRWFGKKDACRIPTDEEKDLFLG